MQLLISQGWKNYHTCTTCSRFGPVQYWSHEVHKDFEIRVRIRKNTFTLLSRGMQIHGPAWTYQIESVLKQFNIYDPEKTV